MDASHRLPWPVAFRLWWRFYWRFYLGLAVVLYNAHGYFDVVLGHPLNQPCRFLLDLTVSVICSYLSLRTIIKRANESPHADDDGQLYLQPTASLNAAAAPAFGLFTAFWWSVYWRYFCIGLSIFFFERGMWRGLVSPFNEPSHLARIIMTAIADAPAMLVALKLTIEKCYSSSPTALFEQNEK